ncbi:unnamed protein product [Arabidopsis halleri]
MTIATSFNHEDYTLFPLSKVLSQVVFFAKVFNEVVLCVLQAWSLVPADQA